MKRLLVLIMALSLLLLMTACGGGENKSSQNYIDDMSSMFDSDDLFDDNNEFNSIAESSDDTSALEDADWKDFLKEYEEWVDKYIAVVKKYKANPTDLSILSEYSSLMGELTDWTERADDISDSIVDVEDAAEYSAELVRIAAKLADAVGDL